MTHAALIMCLALAALAPWRAPRAKRAAPAAQCPRVRVLCPEVIRAGEPATFALEVSGAFESRKLTYTWALPAGTVSSGQHTPVITVDTAGLGGQMFEATVEVEGLPPSCPKTASCQAGAPPACGYSRPVDSYGDISFEDEQARLDNFAIELQNDPRVFGYIVAYGGRRARPAQALRRAERARQYVVGTRAIDSSRVFVIDGGHREDLTVEVYTWPPSVPPPTASPTVALSEVEIIPGQPRPKRAARKPRRRN